MKRFLLIATFALCWTEVSAQTLYVPTGGYSSIQSAIDDANDNDVIIVAEGTYYENIDFLGKAITVCSVDPNDPNTVSTTIIDGSCPADPNIASVVTFANGEDFNSVLTGFTIQNGAGQTDPTVDWRLWEGDNGDGGGVLCSNASPTITKNIFKNCRAEYGGGGIFCHNNASPVITHNTFLNNYAYAYGGAIFARLNCSPTISNNVLMENHCCILGGAIYLADQCYSKVTNNWLEQNRSELLSGGAVYYFVNSAPTFACNVFLANASKSWGSAIATNANSFGTITNNYFAQNVTDDPKGGAIVAGSGAGDLIANNIFADNIGFGIYMESGSTITIRNNILWQNTAGNYGGALDDQTGINGNISADPQIGPALPEPFTWCEFHPNSPCIDAGSNDSLPGWLTSDYDGTSRVVNAVVDIGPQEYHSIAVPQDFNTIQQAINAAQSGDEIVVSPGFYQENIDFLDKNIRLRSLNPLDPNCMAQTVIDGNSLASCVKIISGQDPSAAVAGFTIQNGHGEYGGGIHVDNASGPVIMYNYITNNFAEKYGGGIDSRVECYSKIIHNTIIDNDVNQCGGGIHNGARATCLIENNKILNNSAHYKGGAIYGFNHTNIRILNNQIAWNTADSGGGIYQWDGGGIIEGNTFTENSATLQGGAIGMLTAQTLIKNNLVCGNKASEGAGIWIQSGGSCEIINNTVVGNTADDAGAGIAVAYNVQSPIINNIVANNGSGGGIYVKPYSMFPSEPNVIANNVWNNQGGNYIGDINDLNDVNGNISVDPCFVDPGYWSDNNTPDVNDDYWVQGNYKIGYFSLCRDAGTFDNAPEADFDANPRPHFAGIDIGAYELQVYDLTVTGTVDSTDLSLLTDSWLAEGPLMPADLDTNGIVDFRDFALLAEGWMF